MSYGNEDAKPHQSRCQWTATTTHGIDTVQLHVKGVCQEPTPGYTLTLEPANPQGINPEILLLRLTEVAPTGIEPQHVAPTSVEYTHNYVIPLGHPPKQVTILPEGITIDVQ